MTAGTFAVSRRIWSHPEFAPCEFSEREAFLWLVSEASWKSRTVRAGRVVVDLDRGQLCASIRFMADAWQWSKSRVDRFLKRLEKRDMLVSECGTGQLIITICNYDEYQGERDTSGTVAGQKAGHERDSSGTNYKNDEIQIKTEKEDFDASASLPCDPDTALTKRDATAEILPTLSQWCSTESAKSFMAYRRKQKGKALTLTAARRQAEQLKLIFNAGMDPSDALGMAEERGWQSVQADWYFKAKGNGNGEQSHSNSGRGPSGSSGGMVAAFAAVAARKSAGPIRN